MSAAALQISGLSAWYGESPVLRDIDLEVMQGEVITLLGRHGSGRTSLLRAILGLTDGRLGSIRIRGAETIHYSRDRIAHLGIGHCPQERAIFAGLSCEENLLLPPGLSDTLGGGMSLTEIYDMFPNLYEQRHMPGTRLSGGEQQMLAVARILRTGASLLLLDEISVGLAPVIVQALAQMISTLKAKGYTVIMAEQDFRFAAPFSDRYYLMERGHIAEVIAAGELASKEASLNALLWA